MIRILAVIALRAGVLTGALWLLGITINWVFGLDLVTLFGWVAAVLTVLQAGAVVAILIFTRRGGPLYRDRAEVES